MHSHVPFRVTLIEGTGRKFADAIFQTATGHFGHKRSVSQTRCQPSRKCWTSDEKNYWAS
jgi:hypothetical protein